MGALARALQTLAWELLLGALALEPWALGTFAWELLLGNFGLGTLVWELWLVTLAWELSLGIFSLGTFAGAPGNLAWELSR